MFERAALAHDIDLGRSVMIGDSPCDIEAANSLGMIGIRVATGRGLVPLAAGLEVAAEVADLREASDWIMNHGGLK
jgi:histidinol phosphatase-like enzyme